ncbi:MAG: V-type ATPase subunit [Candidatus Hodarchaeaceae archaeon]|nr:V-type ATPase subunit [Candidatus Hodarchaeaceae archaeon]
MIEVLIFVLALIGAMFALVIISARRSMPYVFCNATISAWEARLLSEARLMELADAPRIVNIFSALEDTEYRPQLAEVAKGEEVDMVAVERALRENLNARYRELIAMVPEQRKGTVLRILQRVDLWNLKALITMIHNKIPKEQRLQVLLSSPTMPRERLEMLTSAEDLKGLLEFLKGSEYFDVISAALEDYEKRGLIALLLALDKHYYKALWEDVLAKRAQRSILKAIIGYEIDSVNIKLILRLKHEGTPPDEIDKYLVKPSHELTDVMLKAMVTAEDVRSAIHMIHITTPGKILAEAMPQIEEQGISAAERALDEVHLKLCRWLEFTQFFSIAPVVSYINLKENEMRNLRAIIRLKADGAEPQKIKEKITRVAKIEL